MNRIPEIVAEGIGVPEGPAWCADGTLVCVGVADGALHRIWPEQKRREKIADTAGGPNAAAVGSDGWFVLTQNGGVDFKAIGAPGEWPPMRETARGLQAVAPDGTVSWLLKDMQAPNDLVIGPDGTIYFTDPRKFPAPAGSTDSRVMALAPDGELRVIADGLHFCNGIAREADGNLVITEANGLMRIYLNEKHPDEKHLDEKHRDGRPAGRKEWIIENLSDKPATDGLCIDVEGRFYLASEFDNGIRIIEGNREVDFLAIPNGGLTTNCCFGGPDNRWLFATDGMSGKVLLWRDMPTPGLPAHHWQPPATLRDTSRN